jgi:hypothetical protein
LNPISPAHQVSIITKHTEYAIDELNDTAITSPDGIRDVMDDIHNIIKLYYLIT